MKIIGRAVVGLIPILCAVAAPAHGAEGHSLSFVEALEAAKAHSPALQQARLGIAGARIDSSITAREDDPSLGLSASLAERWDPKTGDRLTGGRTRSVGGEISYTFLDFGKHSAREKAAELGIERAALTSQGVEQDLYFQVADAYVAWAGAHRREALTREQIKIAEQKYAQQNRDYRQGLRPLSDVVTAEVELGRARLSHLEAQETLRRRLLALLRLMGRERDQGVEFVPLGGGLRDLAPPELLKRVETWNEFRPSAAEKSRQVARQILDAERDGVYSTWYPSLAAVVGVDRSGDRENLETVARGEIRLSWSIPYNGQTQRRAEKLAIQSRDLDLQDKAERDRRQTEALTAELMLKGTAAQWQALKKQMELVERQRELVRQRYVAGQASALELSSVDSEWLRVKLEIQALEQSAWDAAVDVAAARRIPELDFLFVAQGASLPKEKKP